MKKYFTINGSSDAKTYDFNKLKEVLIHYKYITHLNLNNAFLNALPAEIAILINLKSLNLAKNKLSVLPQSMKNLHCLADLNLSNNEFIYVPEVLLFGLRSLRILNLSYNKIVKFNEIPLCLNNILELNISNNCLTDIPIWIFNSLCKLKIIDINNNPISTRVKPNYNYFKSGINESLSILNIKNCNLTSETIEFLHELNNLEILLIGNSKDCVKNSNSFGNINTLFFKSCFKSLKHFSLQDGRVSFLPEDFDNCFQNILHLDLSGNLLPWLPKTFCNLIFLHTLNLNSNQILFLPKCIGNLKNLELIHLCNNKLSYLPKSFSNLKNLKFVDLYNNKLEKFDFSILKNKKLKGIDLENNYLFDNYNYKNIKSKYKNYLCLKTVFRKKFGFESMRNDGQKKKFDMNEISLSLLPKEDDDEELLEIDTHNYAEIPVKNNSAQYNLNAQKDSENNLSDLNDENWDLEVFNEEDDDFFDPNNEHYNYQTLPLNDNQIHLNNNYCPGRNHLPSIFLNYNKNRKVIIDVEEGQFDSD